MAPKKGKKCYLAVFCSVFLVCVIAVLSVALVRLQNKTDVASQNTLSVSSVAEAPPEPEPEETTATVLSTGDIMVHSPQLSGAYNGTTGKYDFTAFFKETSSYYKKADLAVANLEVTFGGKSAGEYSGYPVFNCPDSLATAIKGSGINLLLTANNHSYDTGFDGLKRTAKVLRKKNISYTGTKEKAGDPTYIVKQVNNINIGMINYTYETTLANSAAGVKYLNGIPLKAEANEYINSFNYNKINDFYLEAYEYIEEMRQAGAEFIVFYIHWGNEYQTSPSTHQRAIAQELCNMGVDIIIGSHPHVIQPLELITAEDSTHTAICLYSTGNAVSNQRQELMTSCPSGHTEDGLMFEYTLRKNQEGVVLESIDLIPTWVNKYYGGSGYQYTIYPIKNSKQIEKYGFNSTEAAKARSSYLRTKELVSESLTQCQRAIGCSITFK